MQTRITIDPRQMSGEPCIRGLRIPVATIVEMMAQSPLVAEALRQLGHDAIHVRDIGLARASDDVIFDRADLEGRTLISADTDFAFILATRKSTLPST